MSRPGGEPTIVLLTANDTELDAVLGTFGISRKAAEPTTAGGLHYWDMGAVGGCRIAVLRCHQGSGTPGGAQEIVAKAAVQLQPAAVIAVGTAYGLQRQKGQRLAHVLLAKMVRCYEHQKIVGTTDEPGTRRVPRGPRQACNTELLAAFQAGEGTWNGRTVHVGLVVSAEKLVDDPAYVEQILQDEPEAIGGEMEGTGLVTATEQARIDWIIVKGISDWGIEKAKVNRRKVAARNAASLVHHVLSKGLLGQVYAPAPLGASLTGPELPCTEAALRLDVPRPTKTVVGGDSQGELDVAFTLDLAVTNLGPGPVQGAQVCHWSPCGGPGPVVAPVPPGTLLERVPVGMQAAFILTVRRDIRPPRLQYECKYHYARSCRGTKPLEAGVLIGCSWVCQVVGDRGHSPLLAIRLTTQLGQDGTWGEPVVSCEEVAEDSIPANVYLI